MAVASPEQPVSAIKESLEPEDIDDVDDVEEIPRDDLEPEKRAGESGLQIGVEEILVDVDPHLSLDYLQKADALSGKPPPQRTPRDQLVARHNIHVENQRKMAQRKAPRMVKRVVLALAYPASFKSYKDLTKVGSPRAGINAAELGRGSWLTTRNRCR